MIYIGEHGLIREYMQLKLERPLKTWKVTQKFGNKNSALYGTAGHNGIDLYTKHGTPIYAAHDGLASYQVDDKGGHGVVVITDKEYDYEGTQCYFKTIYWHLCDSLKEPQFKSPISDKTGFIQVKCGDLIGYADNTGHSTGDHLHFGLKPVAKGENWGTWYNLAQNNGYYGAIDPEPFLPPVVTGVTSYFGVNLKYGDKGHEVSKLQTALKNLGFYGDKIDGVYGKMTKIAVLAFQVQYKVCTPLESVYGYYFGQKTRKALNSLK
jgi:hypothetical protein